MKKTFLLLFVFSACFFSQTAPQESLQKLKEGNARFVEGNLTEKNFKADIEATTESQSPYAVIVTCSDSRVPPEIIFDESIGDLFVIRLAGNVIDSAALGSIEYAVKYLKSSYILMLGHTHCGAVHAVVGGGSYSPAITSIAKKINPAFEKVKEMELDEEEIMDETIKENVHLQVKVMQEMSEIISTSRDNGDLKIGGAIYDIADGKVHFFEE